ncbi:amidohydrolase family protein, partial [Legionella pneumophila]
CSVLTQDFSWVNTIALGEDRVLFASDYPMESLLDATRFIQDSDLSNQTKQKIFSINAKNLNLI